ncbi:hypothetical protein [uncultured Duncaniella sp.]|uniref:hypothetical protein n=1 Tax=uncultured Duncaniella sp. TaxID=2768039 RepID=UPI0026EE410E|nr:hypothetical protein [uncultured Duncaniella sp.]
MNRLMLYMGVILVAGGWLAMVITAGQQASRLRQAERMKDRYDEMRHRFMLYRTYCRVAMITGIFLIVAYLCA